LTLLLLLSPTAADNSGTAQPLLPLVVGEGKKGGAPAAAGSVEFSRRLLLPAGGRPAAAPTTGEEAVLCAAPAVLMPAGRGADSRSETRGTCQSTGVGKIETGRPPPPPCRLQSMSRAATRLPSSCCCPDKNETDVVVAPPATAAAVAVAVLPIPPPPSSPPPEISGGRQGTAGMTPPAAAAAAAAFWAAPFCATNCSVVSSVVGLRKQEEGDF